MSDKPLSGRRAWLYTQAAEKLLGEVRAKINRAWPTLSEYDIVGLEALETAAAGTYPFWRPGPPINQAIEVCLALGDDFEIVQIPCLAFDDEAGWLKELREAEEGKRLAFEGKLPWQRGGNGAG